MAEGPIHQLTPCAHPLIYFALGMRDSLPRTQELQFLMEQVELIHGIDEIEKKRKKKRERREQKLKKIAPP